MSKDFADPAPRDDSDDIPEPPAAEFDRDAVYALAVPGLQKEERARIVSEARSLAASGLPREIVGNWICREVARTLGGPSGFVGHDANGNVIDPPYVAAARKYITREAGTKSQDKRNDDLDQWRRRCEQMIACGEPEDEVWANCWDAILDTHHEAMTGKPDNYIPEGFRGLPVLYGKRGKSAPKDQKRLRPRIMPPKRRTN